MEVTRDMRKVSHTSLKLRTATGYLTELIHDEAIQEIIQYLSASQCHDSVPTTHSISTY